LRSQALFGLVLGGGLFVLMLVGPLLNNVGADRRAARRAAAEAGMELRNVDLGLIAMQERGLAPVEALRSADFDALLGNAALWQEPDPNDPTVKGDARERVGMDAAGLRRAADALQAAIQSQRERLQQAEAGVQRAVDASAEVSSPHYLRGAIELARAGLRLAEVHRLRAAVDAALAQLVLCAQDVRAAQIEVDQLSGFDAAPVLSTLEANLAEVSAARKAADARVTELSAAVERTRAELQAVREALSRRQAELRQLEERGFELGDAASFASYRDHYLSIATQGPDSLTALQAREELLAHGGIPNAQVADDDFVAGEVSGGDPAPGLDTLERRLESAQEVARRLGRAGESIESQIAQVKSRGALVAQELERYRATLREQRQRLDQLRGAAAEAARLAFEKEAEALRSAQAAAQAFSRSAAAETSWRRAARDLKNEKDTASKNMRLALINNDRAVEDLGPAAEAEALLAAARAFASRVNGLTSYLAAMERVRELVPDFSFDAAATQTELTTAQQTATTELERAVSPLTRLADAAGPTSWIHQALLGYLYHALAHINPDQEQVYLAQATQRLGQALQGKERSPYLAPHATLLEILKADQP